MGKKKAAVKTDKLAKAEFTANQEYRVGHSVSNYSRVKVADNSGIF